MVTTGCVVNVQICTDMHTNKTAHVLNGPYSLLELY